MLNTENGPRGHPLHLMMSKYTSPEKYSPPSDSIQTSNEILPKIERKSFIHKHWWKFVLVLVGILIVSGVISFFVLSKTLPQEPPSLVEQIGSGSASGKLTKFCYSRLEKVFEDGKLHAFTFLGQNINDHSVKGIEKLVEPHIFSSKKKLLETATKLGIKLKEAHSSDIGITAFYPETQKITDITAEIKDLHNKFEKSILRDDYPEKNYLMILVSQNPINIWNLPQSEISQ